MPERRVALGAEDEIHPEEAVRRASSPTGPGLCFGFYRFDQETYLAVVESYARRLRSPARRSGHAPGRGAAVGARRLSRSGRTAKQFIDDPRAASGCARPDPRCRLRSLRRLPIGRAAVSKDGNPAMEFAVNRFDLRG